MLDPGTWIKAAQETPQGTRRRVTHDCGPGRTMVVFNAPGAWRAYCYRCGDRGWVAKPQPTLAERITRRQVQAAQDTRLTASLALPEPMCTNVAEWPVHAAAWLYKAGIGKPEIARLGAYWHPDSGRVVLPVIQDGCIVYWQARATDWTRTARRPKYINPAVDKTALVATYGSGGEIVLVEDILSAFRVGDVTESWALMGTHLTDAVLAKLLAAHKPVAVWLDPDTAGRKAARIIHRRLAACGIPARIIQSDRDPKLLSKREVASGIGFNPVAVAQNP